MGTSATRAKQKYNAKNYYKITLTLPPNLAEDFRQNATKNNLSQPQFLEKLLDFFLQNNFILEENEKLKKEKNELETNLNEYIDANKNWKNAYDELNLKANNALLKKKNTILEMQSNNNKIAYWVGGVALVLGFILGKFF